MKGLIFLNCEKHGYIKSSEIKVVKIKNIEYLRCIFCKRENDRKFSKTYRNKNKKYYAKIKLDHYYANPEMAMERQRRYRSRKKAHVAQSVEQLIRNE